MKDQWRLVWDMDCGGLARTWSELTPTAHRRIRRLVGNGHDSGRLSPSHLKSR